MSDQYGKVNVSDISADSLNTLSDTRSNINTQINTLSNNHQTLRNNLQSANNTWNTNTSNYIKNTVQTSINTISTTKLSTDVVFSTGFIQDGNNISLDSEMTISSEAVNNTSSTYWELHYKYGSNIPPEIIINNSLTNNASASFGDVTTDMLAWYKFDGDYQNHIEDNNIVTSQQNNPTLNNTDFKFGDHSLELNNNLLQSFTLHNMNIDPNLNKELTISFWMYLTNTQDFQNILVLKNNHLDGVKFVNMNTHSGKYQPSMAGSFRMFCNDVKYNQWTHFVLIMTNTSFKLYNDNVLVGDLDTNEVRIGVTNVYLPSAWQTFENLDDIDIDIGKPHRTDFNYCGGKFDDFRLYNRVLTVDEVSELYNYVPGAVGTTTTSGSATIQKYPRENVTFQSQASKFIKFHENVNFALLVNISNVILTKLIKKIMVNANFSQF